LFSSKASSLAGSQQLSGVLSPVSQKLPKLEKFRRQADSSIAERSLVTTTLPQRSDPTARIGTILLGYAPELLRIAPELRTFLPAKTFSQVLNSP